MVYVLGGVVLERVKRFWGDIPKMSLKSPSNIHAPNIAALFTHDKHVEHRGAGYTPDFVFWVVFRIYPLPPLHPEIVGNPRFFFVCDSGIGMV